MPIALSVTVCLPIPPADRALRETCQSSPRIRAGNATEHRNNLQAGSECLFPRRLGKKRDSSLHFEAREMRSFPPRGGTQPSVAQCSVMKTWRYRRFRDAVSCVFDFVYVSSYLSSRKGLNCISHLERLDQQRFSLGSQILISFCASDMKRGCFRRRFQRPRRDNAVIYPLVAS